MINIEDIIPFMKKGWVAMHKNGNWTFYGSEPHCDKTTGSWIAHSNYVDHLDSFDIAPAEDWEKSLREVK